MPLPLPWGGPEGRSPSPGLWPFSLRPHLLVWVAKGSALRYPKGQTRQEKRGFRGGEVPATPPPVESVVEGDPQTPWLRPSKPPAVFPPKKMHDPDLIKKADRV